MHVLGCLFGWMYYGVSEKGSTTVFDSSNLFHFFLIASLYTCTTLNFNFDPRSHGHSCSSLGAAIIPR